MSCEMSIINQNSFANLLRKTTLIGRCGKRHGFGHEKCPPRSSVSSSDSFF